MSGKGAASHCRGSSRRQVANNDRNLGEAEKQWLPILCIGPPDENRLRKNRRIATMKEASPMSGASETGRPAATINPSCAEPALRDGKPPAHGVRRALPISPNCGRIRSAHSIY
jgi:hypothetical protein